MTGEGPFANLGRALSALRSSRGLSQEAAADRAGMAPSTLSRYESGEKVPMLPSLEKLLLVLEADVVQLGVALQMAQGVRDPLGLPSGLSERERGLLELVSAGFDEFLASAAQRSYPPS